MKENGRFFRFHHCFSQSFGKIASRKWGPLRKAQVEPRVSAQSMGSDPAQTSQCILVEGEIVNAKNFLNTVIERPQFFRPHRPLHRSQASGRSKGAVSKRENLS